MEEKKECYDFRDVKICKVCKCEKGKCDCETHAE